MNFSDVKLVKSTDPLSPNDHSVSFLLNNKLTEIFFSWENNDGEGWSFVLILNHPDCDYSLQEDGEVSRATKEILNDLADELEVDTSFVSSLTKEILVLAQPLYDNSPNCTASESYYGI